MTRVNIRITNNPISAPSSFPRYGIIIPDYDQFWPKGEFDWWPNGVVNVSRPKRNQPSLNVEKGLPSTGRFVGGMRVLFTKDMQLWVHGLCGGTPTTYKSDHAGMWRGPAFMSNDYGIEKYADWINLTKLSNGDPKIEPMGCGGTLLRVVGESATEWIFEAINPFDNYRQYHPSNVQDRHLFFRPGNSRYEIVRDQDGKPIGWSNSSAIPFSQYDNKAWVPILAHGNTNRNRIVKWRVKIIPRGVPIPTPWKTQGGFVYPNPYQGMVGI